MEQQSKYIYSQTCRKRKYYTGIGGIINKKSFFNGFYSIW